MVKLLGPFPKHFSKGECSEEFTEFIGTPLSRYQRMQNISKRLNKCTDAHFLMLIERMLTYIPGKKSFAYVYNYIVVIRNIRSINIKLVIIRNISCKIS